MKIRIISSVLALASVVSVAQAIHRADTRVITMVRDNSGQPVQGASVKFFGPFGVGNRRSEMSTFTGRNGESDKMMTPGRYLVFASDNERGIDSRTFDVSNRSSTSTLEMRLKSTRQPTIQFVVMSDDRNEPISNATLEITNRTTGRRDSLKSRGNGLTPYELSRESNGGRYDVMITSADFDTVNMNVNFSPVSNSSSIVSYVQLRRKTGLRNDPRPNSRSNEVPNIDGMIRLTKKDRIEAGDPVSVSVGLVLSKGTNLYSQCISTVNISGPNGAGILSDSRNVKLTLNEYANSTYDILPRVAGTYTVSVSAVIVNGNGVQNSRWDGKFTFNVQGESRNSANLNMDRGDYFGTSDIELDNRDIKSHMLSLSLAKSSRGPDNVKGWLTPKNGSGFRIEFKGLFDQSTGRLDAKGTMMDRSDKRWDIQATGSTDRLGRQSVKVVIRALDNSYNRTYNFVLAKK